MEHVKFKPSHLCDAVSRLERSAPVTMQASTLTTHPLNYINIEYNIAVKIITTTTFFQTHLDMTIFEYLVGCGGFVENYLSIHDVIDRFTLYVGVQNSMTFNLTKSKRIMKTNFKI